ncbi:MAG: hypothetical protein WA885_00870 [Phormidesmis sp.]
MTAFTFGLDAIPETAPASAEERRQIAGAIAQQCIQVLKQDFGATEAIIFGSLRGDTPWHEGSDLDLAVSGLSSKEIFDAFGALEKIVPSWLPLDLVAVDSASERVRDRILQITPMPENIYISLKLRLNDEMIALEQTVDTINTVLAEADKVSALFVTPTLASYIENFYSGCEKIAERITVSLDGDLPKGNNWHQQLLIQMSEPGGHSRPPLWNQSLLSQLDVYRKFRHRVRHIYNFDLDDSRVLEIGQQAPDLFEKVKQAVEIFGEWLDQQANS